MNREIKFRAFDDSEMLTMPINTNYGLSRFFGCLRDDAVIRQFTGLLDKNGKEIYEGDVLAFDKLSFLGYKCVRFISDTASFSIANISDFKFENNWDIWQRLTSKYISDFK